MARTLAGGAEPVAIRPLGGDEVVALWPLLDGMSHGGAPPPPGDPVPPDVAARVAQLQGRPEHCLSVAVARGELVGDAWAQDHGPGLRRGWSVARLHDLYVTPGWCRRGVGRTLFEAVREWAAQRETVKSLEWQASLPAVAFYERLGFQGDTRADLEEHSYFEITLR